MITLLKNPSQIITVNTNGKNFKRGSRMNDVSPLREHSLVIENDIIKDILPETSASKISFDNVLDLSNKVILPGFVESHTHLVFAGSRADEYAMKLKGSSYEEISLSGGGIMNTVNAVRKSSVEDLVRISEPRVRNFISQGITTLEIKSGYGLDFDNEIKILQVIKILQNRFPVDIIPAFLGAHTFPSEYKKDKEGYIELIINKMLPYIAENGLAEFCDAFCESTAFSPAEVERIFIKAKALGLSLKLHTDQFNSIGGVDSALAIEAAGIDHLEVLPEKYFDMLGNSEIVCTLLPGVSFFLNYQFAPARKLIEKDAIVSVASDYNPGSSNINSVFIIMSLAAIHLKMTVPEIISAYTINAAKALNVNTTRGSIEIGKKADLAVLDTTDPGEMVYNIGQNLNYLTIKNGNIIWKKES